MSVAQRERAALVATMRSVGPDAPTLCDGWTTRDLAAHLVIREYRVDAAPGILIPLLAGHTAKVQDEVARNTEWNALLANVAEMFIHHEDVRRAQPDKTVRVQVNTDTAIMERVYGKKKHADAG